MVKNRVCDLYCHSFRQVKRFYGGHFFSDTSIRFFNSKVESQFLSVNNKQFYFLSSEKLYPNDKRSYTLRAYDFDGYVISNVRTENNSMFLEFDDLKQAENALKKRLNI